MNNKFSENYKKELISKALDYLVKTDEYKCILNEDLESIKNHYYYAWNNIANDKLNAVVTAIENDFNEEFMENGYLWDTIKDCIDCVLTEILDYSYVIDNMWAKNINVPENYYIHALRCALEDKFNYTIEETIEDDNCFLIIHLDYVEDYGKYKPILICYTDILDDSLHDNKIIRHIYTDSEFGFDQGLYVYNNGKKQENIYNDELCSLIMLLLEKKGFNYILSKDRTVLTEDTSVKDNSDLTEDIQVENVSNLNIKDLLMKLDTEIGSTINYANDEKKVLDNMKQANLLVRKIVDMLGLEF